jgi:hypothetical protein
MLTSTQKQIDVNLLSNNLLSSNNFKTTINQPTGNFFYDPWEIDSEYKGSVFEKLLLPLGKDVGEARIIILSPGSCYLSHADIDDRYHLTIDGQYSFLINLDTKELFAQKPDGVWYEMNAGVRHSAANFGSYNRIQLVVRKLLNRGTFEKFVTVKIQPISEKARFIFDDEISPWLNLINKQYAMNNFVVLEDGVTFDLDTTFVSDLNKFSSDKFKITIL